MVPPFAAVTHPPKSVMCPFLVDGIDLQNIKHNRSLSALLLLTMHLTVEIFLFTLAIRFGMRPWGRFFQDVAEVRIGGSEETLIDHEHTTATPDFFVTGPLDCGAAGL